MCPGAPTLAMVILRRNRSNQHLCTQVQVPCPGQIKRHKVLFSKASSTIPYQRCSRAYCGRWIDSTETSTLCTCGFCEGSKACFSLYSLRVGKPPVNFHTDNFATVSSTLSLEATKSFPFQQQKNARKQPVEERPSLYASYYIEDR